MTAALTPSEVEAVACKAARKLSAAQREGLMRQPCRSWWGDAPACMPHTKATADALARKGLCASWNPMMHWGTARPLTPLGDAIRAILKDHPNVG